MEIYDFSQLADQQKLSIVLQEHFQQSNIVPFFGSGFTSGCKAQNGYVPTVNELKEYFISFMVSVGDYSEADCAELREKKLSKIASFFWESLNASNHQQRQHFFNYMETHFSGVHDLPTEKIDLLGCSWRYLYTLNYDDAIEQSLNHIIPVVPYANQNTPWLSHKKPLFKIHGDVSTFLSEGENKYCILSESQYVDLITNVANQNMIANLEADFSSNNIIFFGCSLLEELDLLFASTLKLRERKAQNTDTHIYYVRYCTKGSPALTKVQLKEFEQFSITDIIEVSANEMLSFYSFIRDISNRAAQFNASDNLSKMMGFTFSQYDSHNRNKNIEYLFFSQNILPNSEENLIQLPSFFVHRHITDEIIEDITANHGYLHILRGSRMSGKTYAMIDILHQLQSKKIYFFHSNITLADDALQRIISLENAIILFDEHTLTADQINSLLTRDFDSLRNNQIHIVAAVDYSSGTFTKHYFETFPHMKGKVTIHHISNILVDTENFKEFSEFNRGIGELGLCSMNPNSSFLDYMIQVDDISLHTYTEGLPDIHIFNTDTTNKVVTLILLANQESITISEANTLNIDGTLYNLINSESTNVALQKETLSEIEMNPDVHYRFRFVVNSKYWVYKCLSAFAENTRNYDTIAQIYYDISRFFQQKYHIPASERMPKQYLQVIKPYYFLDTIQSIFFGVRQNGGSLNLSRKIYDKLLPLFPNDYQYLHQSAKCLLWSSAAEHDTTQKKEFLVSAQQKISRAQELAGKSMSPNIHFTLYHMSVTKALISTNFWRFCCLSTDTPNPKNQLSDVLADVQKMVDGMQHYAINDPEDIIKENEMKDMRWLVRELMGGKTRQYLSAQDKAIATDIVNRMRKFL